MADTLYIVVPCYNEEEALPLTAEQLKEKMVQLQQDEKISKDSRVLLVDDGSSDGTWLLIEKLHQEDPVHFSGLKMTRNRGHQNALLAGLMTAKDLADITISMDADLQDDIHAVDEMLEKYKQGYQVVYGVRKDRAKDTAFKRGTAQLFYKFMKFLGVDVVYNHADYRLMSRKALEGLAEFPEVNLFLRGMVPLVGYPSTTVEYSRGERLAGESKYPLKKMLMFAWDGITSFSIRPIRWVTVTGGIILFIGAVLAVITLFRNLFGYVLPGWSSLIISHWILAGIQVLSLGVVGEYVGKIYAETKQRPRFLIEKLLDDKKED